MMHGQAEALLPLIDATMREAGLTVAALDLVAVSTGPGSFTGIRVGLAAARGIALAAALPLIGVTSFEAAAAAPDLARSGRALLVALESRRADLYVQFFDLACRPLGEPAAVLPEALAALSAALVGDQPLALAGDAAARAAAALPGWRAVVVESTAPAALGVLRASLRQWRCGERAGSVRPLYLRPPDATPAGAQRAGAQRAGARRAPGRS
jgi:tRNA threonylcarbamoyladenosine biosynthesis protein TsaB